MKFDRTRRRNELDECSGISPFVSFLANMAVLKDRLGMNERLSDGVKTAFDLVTIGSKNIAKTLLF